MPHNIFDENEKKTVPQVEMLRKILNGELEPIDYIDLTTVISFEGFNYADWFDGERRWLQPRLEELGYTDVKWERGETDSFGPLTRVCVAKNPEGETVKFVYG